MKAIAKFVDDNVRKYPKNPNPTDFFGIINEIETIHTKSNMKTNFNHHYRDTFIFSSSFLPKWMDLSLRSRQHQRVQNNRVDKYGKISDLANLLTLSDLFFCYHPIHC
jgi:hypothetical protein